MPGSYLSTEVCLMCIPDVIKEPAFLPAFLTFLNSQQFCYCLSLHLRKPLHSLKRWRSLAPLVSPDAVLGNHRAGISQLGMPELYRSPVLPSQVHRKQSDARSQQSIIPWNALLLLCFLWPTFCAVTCVFFVCFLFHVVVFLLLYLLL